MLNLELLQSSGQLASDLFNGLLENHKRSLKSFFVAIKTKYIFIYSELKRIRQSTTLYSETWKSVAQKLLSSPLAVKPFPVDSSDKFDYYVLHIA